MWAALPDEEKTACNMADKNEAIEAVKRGYRESTNREKLGADLIELLGDRFGILSLSRNNRNLLMWSHYASSSTGYVVGFDRNHPFLNRHDLTRRLVSVQPVVYSNNRLSLKFLEPEFMEKFLFRKPMEWKYEEEERFFLTLEEPYVGYCVGVDDFGNNIYLSPSFIIERSKRLKRLFLEHSYFPIYRGYILYSLCG